MKTFLAFLGVLLLVGSVVTAALYGGKIAQVRLLDPKAMGCATA